MSEHALDFVIRCGVWGWQGAISPSPCFGAFFFFFWLVSSVTYGDDDNTPTQWRRHGGSGGGAVPPMIFVFVCLFLVVSSAVGHGHDSTSTPLFNFCDKFLKSDKTELFRSARGEVTVQCCGIGWG